MVLLTDYGVGETLSDQFAQLNIAAVSSNNVAVRTHARDGNAAVAESRPCFQSVCRS